MSYGYQAHWEFFHDNLLTFNFKTQLNDFLVDMYLPMLKYIVTF